MLRLGEVKTFKTIAEMQVNQITGGAMYLATDGDTITWNVSSKGFRIEALEQGKKLSSQSCSMRAINEKRQVSEKLPRSLYGTRIHATATPIVNESGQVVGAATIVFPRLHPVAAAFIKFAPILAEMFPDGAFLYITDLQKVILRQTSRKFEIEEFQEGYVLQETDVAFKAIHSKDMAIRELNFGKNGVPVLVINYPLTDEENESEIVGTLGIVMPKNTAVQLREMSNDLNVGLNGVSATIEQLASSAAQIHTNERVLYASIKEIAQLSEEIENISVFIRGISDQTNLLGLNAAIEAARSGKAGLGFSIVADEIRKLSERSKSTVPKIKELTGRIKEKADIAGKTSEVTLDATQQQAAATQEITASVEELAGMSDILRTISQNI